MSNGLAGKGRPKHSKTSSCAGLTHASIEGDSLGPCIAGAGPAMTSCGWSKLLRAADQPDLRLGPFRQAAIGVEIIERHPPCSVACFEMLADRLAAQRRE